MKVKFSLTNFSEYQRKCMKIKFSCKFERKIIENSIFASLRDNKREGERVLTFKNIKKWNLVLNMLCSCPEKKKIFLFSALFNVALLYHKKSPFQPRKKWNYFRVLGEIVQNIRYELKQRQKFLSDCNFWNENWKISINNWDDKKCLQCTNYMFLLNTRHCSNIQLLKTIFSISFFTYIRLLAVESKKKMIWNMFCE